jgi:RND family efflux transporter MFP subunit
MRRALAGIAMALAIAGAVGCSRDPNVGSDQNARRDQNAGSDPGLGIGDQNHAAHASSSTSGSPIPDPRSHEITLSPDMIQRAGIKTVAAIKGTATTRLHLPGVVQPNAYKNIDVTSLVSGRITQVRAELGQRVMLSEVLATVYSPELADAQTAFIAAKANRDAHGLKLTRTQRLYAIGAASREELEQMTAEATEMDRALETARSRLVLLGIPEDRAQRLATPADVVTAFEVKAPFPGIVTKRNANIGLNIDPSTALFTVTDLSTVWVVADLYERDFAGVGVGSPATITTMAYPGLELHGRVDYIDPQVQPETRTAKLRAEVPNSGNRFRLGMFVDVSIGSRTARSVVMVPKSAVQTVGTQTVVYVSTGPGRFTPREVTVGETMGNDISVTSGLEPAEAVVAEGAFFIRAEVERLP